MVRIDAMAYSTEGVLEENDTSVGRCRELIEKYGTTWINIVDMDSRTRQELETLFALHPLALEDASRTDISPKVEQYDDILFVVVRTILWTEEIETDQLSVFLSKRYVITFHDKVFPHLEDVRSRIRKKDPKLLRAGSDFLAYLVLDTVVDSYFPNLDRLDDIIEGLEESIVKDPTGASIDKIHSVRTDLLRVRNALRPQRDAFSHLTRIELPFFKKETRNYLRDAYDHMIRALDTMDTQRETVTSLMEVQATLVSNALNEILKVLTAISTIILPLTLITGFFGMNVAFFGNEDRESGFWVAVVIMAAVGAGTIAWLRHRRWL